MENVNKQIEEKAQDILFIVSNEFPENLYHLTVFEFRGWINNRVWKPLIATRTQLDNESNPNG